MLKALFPTIWTAKTLRFIVTTSDTQFKVKTLQGYKINLVKNETLYFLEIINHLNPLIIHITALLA